MKSNNELRGPAEDSNKKGVKLPPMKKSGKDKFYLYSDLGDIDEELELESYKQRESVLDYFDDGEEDF